MSLSASASAFVNARSHRFLTEIQSTAYLHHASSLGIALESPVVNLEEVNGVHRRRVPRLEILATRPGERCRGPFPSTRRSVRASGP